MVFLSVTGGWNKDQDEEEEEEEEESGEAKSEVSFKLINFGTFWALYSKEGEKKSLKEKMQAMQEIALLIQVLMKDENLYNIYC